MLKKMKGFTLIELLIVIAIIAIIAAIVYVALNPLQRFQDSRDSTRAADIVAVANAIKLDVVDNGGTFVAAVDAMTTGIPYMIGTDLTSCETYTCDTSVVSSTACVDLSALVTEGYLGVVPTSPNGDGTWTVGHTGYTLEKATSSVVTVRSCESENSTEIKTVR